MSQQENGTLYFTTSEKAKQGRLHQAFFSRVFFLNIAVLWSGTLARARNSHELREH